MNTPIKAGPRRGFVQAPPSKSLLHRYLICAALSKGDSLLRCGSLPADALATLGCLKALGAEIERREDGLQVRPIKNPPAFCRLHCGESGSTLRFLLPIAASLGVEAEFYMDGNLKNRPMAALERELRAHGVEISRSGNCLKTKGQLQSGEYSLPGKVSSQYVSALMLALPRLAGDSGILIEGELQSAAYAGMTKAVLLESGVNADACDGGWTVKGGQSFALPPEITIEGDWSAASFFLCAGALSKDGIGVGGLNLKSGQPDMAILSLLRKMGADISIEDGAVFARRGSLHGTVCDLSPIPDLAPPLAALAALSKGQTRMEKGGRLRYKESDRLESTAALVNSLGGRASIEGDTLVIEGKARLKGGCTDSFGDHRIAMAAAVAACGCTGSVKLDNMDCVEKSYPDFWRDFSALEMSE